MTATGFRDGFWQWRDRHGAVEVRFLGRGEADGLEAALAAASGDGATAAWAEQVHSARVLPARAGCSGRGDALVTRDGGLALCVVTADCVPLVLAAGGSVAAVHAGWRGIAAGIAKRAVSALDPGSDAEPVAWLGPAIGPCCYEVGDEVARRVADASGPRVVVTGGSRPHLDLPRALEIQLAAAGVRSIRRLGVCTRCHPEQLWSYRRDGERAGRNFCFVWRRLSPRGGGAACESDRSPPSAGRTGRGRRS